MLSASARDADNAAMHIYRYPRYSLNGDYLRAFVGLAVGIGVLLSARDSFAVNIIFGAVALLFGTFLLRTIQRSVTKVALSEEEIARADFMTKVIPWDSLERLKLRYFGTRRERRQEGGGRPSGGFWQLTLSGAGGRMVFESNLEGFDMIAWRAARAARENGVSIDPTSAGNLLALGVDADGEGPPPDGVGLPHGRISDLADDKSEQG
jgi:hypothetical protein